MKIQVKGGNTSMYEPKYQCRSEAQYGLIADTSPDARLYCSMVAFIEANINVNATKNLV